MKNYVLIHGAWGGSWEYNKIAESLSKDGHNVIALDLPGSAENKANIADVTMQAYVNTVVEAIEKLNDKVVLLGHSLAGAVISQVAELIPEKIDRLIYVTAMLLKDGDTSLGVLQNDPSSEILPNAIFSEDGTYVTLSDETVRTILLNDEKNADYLDEIVPKFLYKQATEPFTAVANLSEEKFGSVDKHYIRTSNDKVVTPLAQDKMLTNWKTQSEVTVESGHIPLTSIPEKLVEEIRRIG
jgi:pimeloyl-ACP methyl ester carboxylesterase